MEVINTIDKLDDVEFLAESWVTDEEIPLIKEELTKEIEKYKSEAKSYVEYKLKERQDYVMQIPWIEFEIKRLQELASWYQKKADRVEKWIDYIMQTFQIEKLETMLHKLSYRTSESVSILDEALIPDEFKTAVETIKISKSDIKSRIKAGVEVPGASIQISKNLQIK